MYVSKNLCLLYRSLPILKKETPFWKEPKARKKSFTPMPPLLLCTCKMKTVRNVIYFDTQLLSNQIKPMFLNVTLIFQNPLKPSKTDTKLAIVTHTQPNTTQRSFSSNRVGLKAQSLPGLTKIRLQNSQSVSLVNPKDSLTLGWFFLLLLRKQNLSWTLSWLWFPAVLLPFLSPSKLSSFGIPHCPKRVSDF